MIRGGLQPEADPRKAVEGRQPTAVPVQPQYELVQVPLEALSAQTALLAVKLPALPAAAGVSFEAVRPAQLRQIAGAGLVIRKRLLELLARKRKAFRRSARRVWNKIKENGTVNALRQVMWVRLCKGDKPFTRYVASTAFPVPDLRQQKPDE